jgi:hypothetical protein
MFGFHLRNAKEEGGGRKGQRVVGDFGWRIADRQRDGRGRLKVMARRVMPKSLGNDVIVA